ncbi:uncharacterized protein EV154DRAFT_502982 [Mucor mucedo]|uniref:uncharacterized protein n=1 Tax=Mucor mucedo TaxID=29922 RepID=UPI00222085B6|nr:uncharacterized protein EV154DRAFT_502982 [Mucor mucedo]KAI7893002.1 hypothetical protein EV154DRAFT_502982 [Mucor mucedo]
MQYFVQSELYQQTSLRISERMKLSMDRHFGNILENYSEIFSTEEEFYPKVKPKIREFLTEGSFDKFFFSTMDDANLDNNNFVTLHKPGYLLCFKYIYLAYVNKLISSHMDKHFGHHWREMNVGYVLFINPTVEKTCFFTSRTDYLLYGSCILDKDDRKKKGRILWNMGGIITKIPDASFPVKSFFALVSMGQTEICIQLHQVVKLSSENEDVSTIVIWREL